MRLVLLGVLGLGLATGALSQTAITAYTDFAEYETVTVSPAGTYLAVTHRGSLGESIAVLELPDLNATKCVFLA